MFNGIYGNVKYFRIYKMCNSFVKLVNFVKKVLIQVKKLSIDQVFWPSKN